MKACTIRPGQDAFASLTAKPEKKLMDDLIFRISQMQVEMANPRMYTFTGAVYHEPVVLGAEHGVTFES